MSSVVRAPAVAGRFYPASPAELLRDVREYSSSANAERVCAIGCVVPHAGYMYSGHVAGAVYSRLEIPERCIILCPNHTGRGAPLAIMTSTAWETPLGKVRADVEFGSRLLQRYRLLTEDSAAHRAEHAIEVQLPFLQTRQSNLILVPVAVGTSNFEALHGLGEALAEVIQNQNEKVLIIASSDMNHYEPDAITRIKDRKAIDRVLAMDARGLWEVVMNEDISMCGFGPTIAMLTAAKQLGAADSTLVRYATSGDVSGDRQTVVGYAGIIVQ